MRILPLTVLGVLALVVCAGPAAAGLVGHSFRTGILYDVNPLTGATSNARDTHLGHLDGVAAGPGGSLFGLATPGRSSFLYAINAATGAASPVGATGLDSRHEADLAFDPTSGALYGIFDVSNTHSTALVTLDTVTGEATLVADIDTSADLAAMAFDAAGNLYVLATGGNGNSVLLQVDKATGAVLSSVTTTVNLGSVAGLAIDRLTGAFYVSDGVSGPNDFFTLDPTTGMLTLLGTSGVGNGLAGLSFVPEASVASANPEPATLVSGAVGTVLLAGYGLRAVRARRRQPMKS